MALFTHDMPLKTLPSEKAPAALDAFYVTRLQRERRAENEGADQGGYVRFDAQALKGSRTHEAVVMHPLPRTDELAWDSTPIRARSTSSRRRRECRCAWP